METGLYRFIRLDWRGADKMSDELNKLLNPRDSVVNISVTNDEVLILVKEHDEYV